MTRRFPDVFPSTMMRDGPFLESHAGSFPKTASIGSRCGGGALGIQGTTGPAIVKGSAPSVVNGVMSGDVSAEAAVIWSRTDRPARMIVEWSTTSSFSRSQARRRTGDRT